MSTSIPAQGSSARAHISRRRVVTGAAWTVPAVLVATSAPAAAASTDPKGTMVFNQTPIVAVNPWWVAGTNYGPTAKIAAQLRWAGPYSPVGNAITSISFIVIVPKTASATGDHFDSTHTPGADFNKNGGAAWNTTVTRTDDVDNWYLHLTLQGQIDSVATETKLTEMWVPLNSIADVDTVSVLATGSSVGVGSQPSISYP